MSKFEFEDSIEYPSGDEIAHGIQPNVLFDYVNVAYLNGFINYVDIIGGAMLQRYMKDDEFNKAIEQVNDHIADGSHTDVSWSEQYDDIVVLGRTDSMYVYFYADRDVSDCMIGGLPADKFASDEEAFNEFMAYVIDCHNFNQDKTGNRFYKLPKEFFTGWIKL